MSHSLGVARRHFFWAALLFSPALIGAAGCGNDDRPSVSTAQLDIQCSSSAECAPGRFCSFALDDACGLGGQLGTCQATPNMCSQENNPVCGCDRTTYGNECLARAAGVGVWSQLACPGLGDPCTDVGPDCPTGQFCKFSIAEKCGVDPGVCEMRPSMCSQEYLPVCGCDRNTYNNECLADAAGVSVAGPGSCP